MHGQREVATSISQSPPTEVPIQSFYGKKCAVCPGHVPADIFIFI